MKISWTKVTWYSTMLTLIFFFVGVPLLGYKVYAEYQGFLKDSDAASYLASDKLK